MAITIPCFANGRDTTVCTITPIDVDSATCVVSLHPGASNISIRSLIGSIKGYKLKGEVQTENLSSMSNPYPNELNYENGMGIDIEEFTSKLAMATANKNNARYIFHNKATATSALVQVVITEGAESFWIIGMVKSFEEDKQKAACYATISIIPSSVYDSTLGYLQYGTGAAPIT